MILSSIFVSLFLGNEGFMKNFDFWSSVLVDKNPLETHRIDFSFQMKHGETGFSTISLAPH